MPRVKTEIKQEIAMLAMQQGIAETARQKRLAYTTVSRWMQAYSNYGLAGLENKNSSFHVRNLQQSQELTRQIADYKLNNPMSRAKEIKEKLNLKASIQTINKKIRQFKECETSGCEQNDEIIQPFQVLIADCSRLLNCESDRSLPDYQLLVIDMVSGICYCGFSYEKSNLAMAVFIDYVLEFLKNSGADILNSNILTGRGQEFISYSRNKKSLFENIVQEKYQVAIVQNSLKDRIRLLKDKLIFDKRQFNSANDLLLKSFALNLQYNHLNSREKIRTDLSPEIINLPPILVDSHISDLPKIKHSHNYWSLCQKSVDVVIGNTLRYYGKISSMAKTNFRISEALKYYDTMIYMAELASQTGMVLEALQSKAYLSRLNGSFQTAELSTKQAIRLLKKSSNYSLQIRIIRQTANQFVHKADYEQAANYTKQALQIALEQRDDFFTAICLNDLAVYAMSVRDFKQSKEYFSQAKAIGDKSGNEKLQALIYGSLGLLYTALNEHENSIEAALKSLELAKKAHYYEGVTADYINLGVSYCDLKKFDLAKINYTAGLRMVWLTGYRNILPNLYNNLGTLFARQNNLVKAESYYRKKMAAALLLSDKMNIVSARHNLAYVFFTTDRKELAVIEVKTALQEMLTINRQEALKSLNTCLLYFQETGLIKEGIKYIKKYAYLISECTNMGYVNNFRSFQLYFLCREAIIKRKPRVSRAYLQTMQKFMRKHPDLKDDVKADIAELNLAYRQTFCQTPVNC